MVSPREIFRLTWRFSPSEVSRSALIVQDCSPTWTQLSGSPISSASAELPASTSPIDRISVLLPTPLSPSSSVHFRVTPELISNGSVSDRMQRTLVSSTRVRNICRALCQSFLDVMYRIAGLTTFVNIYAPVLCSTRARGDCARQFVAIRYRHPCRTAQAFTHFRQAPLKHPRYFPRKFLISPPGGMDLRLLYPLPRGVRALRAVLATNSTT